jgi:hypothetical protein
MAAIFGLILFVSSVYFNIKSKKEVQMNNLKNNLSKVKMSISQVLSSILAGMAVKTLCASVSKKQQAYASNIYSIQTKLHAK